MLEVAPVRRWIGVGALLVLVAAAVLWAAVAVVPTTLAGRGVLLPEDGLAALQAPVTGTVTSLALAAGRHVTAGDRVGTIVSHGAEVPLTAPQTGVVSESAVQLGEVVELGESLALIEPSGRPAVLYAYVPLDVGAGLAPGTPVRVGFGRAFGAATGRVRSVSRFAVTQDRLAFILRDDAIVGRVRALGPASEVVVELDPSGRAAPPTGAPATLTYVVGSHHPIDDVL